MRALRRPLPLRRKDDHRFACRLAASHRRRQPAGGRILHIRIDQRSASVTGRLHDEDVVQRPHVLWTAAVPVHHVGARRPREGSGLKASPALENGYLDTRLGEAARGNGTSEPAADDDRLVALLTEGERRRWQRLTTCAGSFPARWALAAQRMPRTSRADGRSSCRTMTSCGPPGIPSDTPAP